MKQIFVLFASLLLATGCTKQDVQEKVCDAGKAAAAVVASQIANELGCSNVSSIRADLEAKLVDAKMCEAKSAIGAAAICTPVIEGIIAGATTQLPPSWGCSGGPLAADLKDKLIAACSKIF